MRAKTEYLISALDTAKEFAAVCEHELRTGYESQKAIMFKMIRETISAMTQNVKEFNETIQETD